jgi:peptidoglycan/xylan/chitin deacetylase (PgdA/CDA1 family)
VRWPGNAALALSLVVNYEEGAERSLAAGDDRNEGFGEIAGFQMAAGLRDLHTESVFEYGSRAGVWRLLGLFREYEVHSTFYACAVAIEANPAVGAALREGHHEACGHGWRWDEPWLLSREEERERIARTVESLERTCGERPVGWACRFGPSVHTRELLREHGGFLYDSDARNDDLPFFVDAGGRPHLVVPYTDVYNDGRYVLAQGFSAPADFFDLCRRAVDELRREGNAGFPKLLSIGLHARWAGQAGRASALRELIEHALGYGDVWFATRREIAEWWLAHHEEWKR